MNLRSNIDAQLAKGLSLSLGVSGRIEKRDAPKFSADPDDWMNIPQQVCYALPYVQDTYEYNGKIYDVSTPTSGSPVAPIASIYDSGYNRSNQSYMQSNFSLKYDTPWLKGLSLKFQGAYDLVHGMTKQLTKPNEVMIMDLPNAATTTLTYHKDYSVLKDTPILSESASRAQEFTTQTSITYDNKFGDHSIGVLLLAETRERNSNNLGVTGTGLDFIQLDELNQITGFTKEGKEQPAIPSGSSSQTRVAGFVGRLNYNYADKYYLEASLRHDGSYLFGGMNKRWVTLPGLSLAWRINNEKWFHATWVDNLKLRAGIGKLQPAVSSLSNGEIR